MAKKKKQPDDTPAAPPTSWPERLKRLRDRNKLTQAEAAKRVCASTRSWVAWEKGELVPSPPFAKLIDMLERGWL